MSPALKNALALATGIISGIIVNITLVNISGNIIPLPEGIDHTTTEGLKTSIHLFAPKHFIFPFLAHALGTFTGAFITTFTAATHKMKFAIAIGCFFLLGGISAVAMLPAPLWFSITDLAAAYLPMAFIGEKLATKLRKSNQ